MRYYSNERKQSLSSEVINFFKILCHNYIFSRMLTICIVANKIFANYLYN